MNVPVLKRRRQAALLAVPLALLGIAAVIASEGWVQSTVAGRIGRVEDAPPFEVALILGAPPGALLDARMDAGCLLVAHRTISSLLLSGLPNEMPTMLARARACIGEDRIVVDDQANRTLVSLLRAREKHGVGRALLVSQAYHLPRALYLADAVGIEAWGVVAVGEPSVFGRLRESVASVRATLDVALLGRAQ